MKKFWDKLPRPIVALAPMDWYSDSPFRQIVREISPKTVLFSEFYSADGLIRSEDFAKRALWAWKNETPLIIQIFWNKPESFVKAAEIIERYDITGIDINMWCPAKKVVKNWYWSQLIIDIEAAYNIVEKLSKASKLPISVKTRLWWNGSESLIDFAKWLENAGASLISVHWRTVKQWYTWKADFSQIYELKKHVSIPVIANWDILDYDDWIEKLKNLDGFMIWRASLGNPWTFLPWKKQPTLDEILSTMRKHSTLLLEHRWERKWILEMRKHLSNYVKSFPWARKFRSWLVRIENLDELDTILEDIKNNQQ